MKSTARRVLAVTAFAVLAGAIEGRVLAQIRTTAHVDTIFTFSCSPQPISVHFVGDLTFITTYHHDRSGTLEIARQHVAAKFNHYNPETGKKTSHDNWSISVTANYAENTTTVTGAYLNSTPSAVVGLSSVTWNGSSSTVRSTTSLSSISSGQVARLA